MVQSPSDQLAEADRLVQQAVEQFSASPQTALQFLQQALGICQEAIVRKAFSRESQEWGECDFQYDWQ